MFKALKMAFVAGVAVVGLSGCATMESIFGKPTVDAVQQAVLDYCGWYPTGASIAALLLSGNPLVSSVAGASQLVCQALTATGAQGSDVEAKVFNVPIKADYIGKK